MDEYDSKYCYPQTFTLINDANIKNKEALSTYERRQSGLSMAEAQRVPVKGNFDFKHLQQLHKFIFKSEVFSKIAKDGSMLTDSKETVFAKLAEHFGDINALHAFREGNGRTQRTFIQYQAKVAGIHLDYSKSDSAEMLEASKKSLRGDTEELKQILAKRLCFSYLSI